MATVIRAEISKKNKYWLEKHRYYELKHFCLQYKEWKKAYALCNESIIFTSNLNKMPSNNMPSDLTAKYAIRREYYSSRIRLIEDTVKETDEYLYPYILKAVTEGLSYTHLKSRLEIPCSRDLYYDRYRRFFWLLSQERN